MTETNPIDEIPKISKPANRALQHAGYNRLEQFTKVTKKEILNIHGVGPKGIRILKEALVEKGLTIAKEE